MLTPWPGIWHIQTERLGDRARRILSKIDEGRATGIIPAVAVAECLMVARKKRIPALSLSRFKRAMEILDASPNWELSVLRPELILESERAKEIPDIFDQLIVTEALYRDIPLITKDKIMVESGLVEIVWD